MKSESLEMEQVILNEMPIGPEPVVDLRKENVEQQQSILLTDVIPYHFYPENPKELAMHQFGMVFDAPVSSTFSKPK